MTATKKSPTPTCHECGDDVAVDDSGIATHVDEDSPTGINHERDADHTALPDNDDMCSFQPETWGDWPGIGGPVLLCNTHGHPGVGSVYDSPPGQATGVCQAVES